MMSSRFYFHENRISAKSIADNFKLFSKSTVPTHENLKFKFTERKEMCIFEQLNLKLRIFKHFYWQKPFFVKIFKNKPIYIFYREVTKKLPMLSLSNIIFRNTYVYLKTFFKNSFYLYILFPK